jgi:hypothetical protein
MLTAPFRAVWHALDPQTQGKWGYAFNQFVARRLGQRATLLPPTIFMALIALGLLLLRKATDPIPLVIAIVMLLFVAYLGGIYLVRLINGEEGLDENTRGRVVRRPSSSGIRGIFDRFGSPATRLARHREVDGLMALAVNSSPKDRADAINRLWGLSRKLSSSQRERFAQIARLATRDPDAVVRGQALFALGELKEPSDIAGLEAALSDPDWFVRLAAAYALSWQQPRAAATSVARLLDDDESMVREQVTGILQAMAQNATDRSARHEAIAILDAAGLPRK